MRPLLTIVFTASATVLSAQVSTTIAAGTGQLTVGSQGNHRRGLAVAPDGRLFAMVREADPTDSRLVLHVSADGGASWTRLPQSDTPTSGDGSGAIVFGNECRVLHAAWNATGGTAVSDVHYQTFDIGAGQWLGQPVQLTTGTGVEDQYYANDVEVTAQGAVVVVISTHRRPSGVWSSGWSTGIVVKPAGASTFDPVRQVNTDLYGQAPDAQATGEVVHLAFRTNTGLYGTRYRAFDAATGTFTSASDAQVEQGTSNVSCIGADASGDLYAVYNTGGTAAGSGEIRVAFATAANPTAWTAQTVALDPDLIRGNVSYTHYSLASVDGDAMAVIYSKLTVEQHRTLYYRILVDGVFATQELTAVATNEVDRFAVVAGLRSTQSRTTLTGVTESRAVSHPGRRVEYFAIADSGRTVRFGRSCRGALATWPSLAPGSVPRPQSTLSLDVRSPAPGQPGLLLAGITCLGTPIALAPIGLGDCALFHDTLVSLTFVADPSGFARVSFPVPASPPYLAVPLQWQAFVVAPGANPLGGLTTNGLMTWIR
jgi:hypothetical protein